VLEEHMRQKTSQEWFEILTDAGLLVGRVLDYESVLRDPQVKQNQPFVLTRRPSGAGALTPRAPYVLDDGAATEVKPPPILGADTVGVMTELGYSASELAELLQHGVVSSGDGS
jgi:crotonobetainyl-CoA:carnitine CoA-transferase CaiB-like acyl-CoA transferase